MKIAFDLRWIRGKQIDGTSRYAINLISHLLQMNTGHHFMLIGDQALIEQYVPLSTTSSHAEIVAIPQVLLSIRDFLLTPGSVRRLNVDIYHAPYYLASPFKGKYKKILTVFDLIPFLFPEALSKSRLFWKLFYATTYPASLILRSADVVIASSENTKRDIVRLLRIPAERIQVVWPGLHDQFHPGIQVNEQFYHHYQLPSNFLLYVGRQDPYKGLRYLVQAYAHLPEVCRQTCKVVIAGKTDERYIGEVRRLVETLNLQGNVIFLNYFPDTDLPQLYSAATMVVHPSLYEGFGFPPLEAMACGTPVVYADTSSLTELVGEAGLGVAPASVEALSDGIRTLLEDEHLRKTYAEKGIQHSKRYSWSNAARRMLELYAATSRDR